MLHALLIDDEAAARADLRAKLAAHAGVTIVGEAATVNAARALLTSAEYDLVFLDVQLIGGDSFVLTSDVRAGAALIFASGHDAYAARAFGANAVDYLLKPIDPVRLDEALRRARRAQDLGPATEDRDSLRAFAPRPAPAAANDPLGIGGLPVPARFREVTLTEDERVYLRQCLEAWEHSLPPAHELRVSSARPDHRCRTVVFTPEREPTRLFLAEAPLSRPGRWWRALRWCLGG